MLCAHFTSSAEAGSLNVRTSPPKGASSSRMRAIVCGCRLAITVIHGLRKSSTAVAARRNSGLDASSKPVPTVLPDSRSRTGRTSSSLVPGGTVERTTTVCTGAEVARARPTAAVPSVKALRS